MNRIPQIESMLANNPDDSFLTFALAKELENENRWEEAIENYYKLVTNDPEYVGTYYHLAQALIECDRNQDEIKKVFDDGISICTKLADLHAKAELQNAMMNWEMEL